METFRLCVLLGLAIGAGFMVGFVKGCQSAALQYTVGLEEGTRSACKALLKIIPDTHVNKIARFYIDGLRQEFTKKTTLPTNESET